MKNSWRSVPKIINKLPKGKDNIIMYIDESGEGSKKTLKKAYEALKEKHTYQQRNDIYLLNGIVLNGFGE